MKGAFASKTLVGQPISNKGSAVRQKSRLKKEKNSVRRDVQKGGPETRRSKNGENFVLKAIIAKLQKTDVEKELVLQREKECVVRLEADHVNEGQGAYSELEYEQRVSVAEQSTASMNKRERPVQGEGLTCLFAIDNSSRNRVVRVLVRKITSYLLVLG